MRILNLQRKLAAGHILGQTAAWTTFLFLLLPGVRAYAGAPVAVNDLARTTQNLAVTIPVLSNDWSAEGNQLSILKVMAPLHGQASLISNNVPLNPELARLFQFARTQLSNSVFLVGGPNLTGTNRYPRRTYPDGTWRCWAADNWVSGFFPGCLWYMFEQTGDSHFQDWAVAWMGCISSNQYFTTTDDVGFEINCSFGAGYRLTGNPAYKAVVLQAAQSMTNCYNAAAGCVGLWDPNYPNSPFDCWIDTMMNVELLFRAYTLGGDTNLYHVAFSHAEKTMLNQVRPDGSTYHIVHYNPYTGAVVSRGTWAGASDDSTWARGQSWAIYGFTMVYRETGDTRFLNIAQRLADYYLSNVPPDHVPYWDYQAPNIPNEPRDSSSAAIALSALLELCQQVPSADDSARYWREARHIFDSLSSSNYLAQGTLSSGILLHGTGEPPHFTPVEVDVSLIYGDYYFIEALMRYEKLYRQTALTYVPDPDFFGTDTFTYQVADSAGHSSTAKVTVVVEPESTNTFTAQIALAPITHRPVISFPTVVGSLYHVEYVDNLTTVVPWSILATNLVGTGAVMSISDTNPPNQRFYRVGQQ